MQNSGSGKAEKKGILHRVREVIKSVQHRKAYQKGGNPGIPTNAENLALELGT